MASSTKLSAFNLDHFDPYLPCITDKIISCDHCYKYQPNVAKKRAFCGHGFYLSDKKDVKNIIFCAFRCLELEVKFGRNKSDFRRFVYGFSNFKKFIKEGNAVKIAKVYKNLIKQRNIQLLCNGTLTLTDGFTDNLKNINSYESSRINYFSPSDFDDKCKPESNSSCEFFEPCDSSVSKFDNHNNLPCLFDLGDIFYKDVEKKEISITEIYESDDTSLNSAHDQNDLKKRPCFSLNDFEVHLPRVSVDRDVPCAHCELYKPNYSRTVIHNSCGFYLFDKKLGNIFFCALRCLELEVRNNLEVGNNYEQKFNQYVSGFKTFKNFVNQVSNTIPKIYKELISEKDIELLRNGSLTLTEGFKVRSAAGLHEFMSTTGTRASSASRLKYNPYPQYYSGRVSSKSELEIIFEEAYREVDQSFHLD